MYLYYGYCFKVNQLYFLILSRKCAKNFYFKSKLKSTKVNFKFMLKEIQWYVLTNSYNTGLPKTWNLTIQAKKIQSLKSFENKNLKFRTKITKKPGKTWNSNIFFTCKVTNFDQI